MPSKAKISLLGHVARDPESRYTAAGKQMLTFSMGVNDGRKRGEEFEEHTTWYRVTWFGGDGVARVLDRLSKGTLVFVTGRLSTNESLGTNGKTYFNVEVAADDITIAERSTREEGVQLGGSSEAPASRPAARPARPSVQDLEDLPF